jgi:EAL domain-containing protein (putative c-di-GMP-specific phosphodiesterase class I)
LTEESAMLPEMFRQLVTENNIQKEKLITAIEERERALKDDKRLRKEISELKSEKLRLT